MAPSQPASNTNMPPPALPLAAQMNSNYGQQPMSGMMSGQQPYNGMYGVQQQMQPRPMGMGMMPPQNASVLAPGMLNPTAPRKTIPDAPGANSGFAFMGGAAPTAGSPMRPTNDSFNFVTDAMRDMNKK